MKQITRAFSLGLLVAAVIIGVTYYLEKPEQAQSTTSPTIYESIQQIEDDGYYVYDEDLESKVDELEQKIEGLQQNTDNELDGMEDDTEDQTEETTITIESGMTIQEIVELLDDNELLSDENAFITYLEENELGRFIQTGEFSLHNDMTIEELANTLTRQTEE
ncbi:hypothetical protein GI584_13180 [Gracilibacillus salitolerans]|uniref:YceG-like family protein n=1 Tax=Gracilibacillus salitolerans TaxID=2663022 RepID=A0A5Q2TJS8_9BACI|nr:endolytic transglycosylase MltG [Gracilibacillus salitolerans]QGH34935.1 hypothetical protein GI584_13180 [Gracilibacillus salitolerans]